ncbi:MAG: hypothetical protein WAV05_06805 [Anaerolineales bacterium]
MKYLRFLLIFVIVLAGVGLYQTPARAGAFTYTSGISLQNLADATANITLHFYLPDGSEDPLSPIDDTIDPLGSAVYFPIPTEEGFSGSVVIESDVQIASISNILGDGGVAAAAYDGSSEGGMTVGLPLLMKGNSGYNTWFNVQNAGAAEASVTVDYSDGTSASATVAVGAAATFDQMTETHTPHVFSGIVTADQPVAVTVIEENADTMFAYSGFNATSTEPVLPLINANNAGYITGINVQNTGMADTDVTITYSPSLFGTECTETQTVTAGGSATFALYAFSGTPLPGMTTTCVGGERFVGSAQVTDNSAGEDLTAVVNQLKPGVNGEAYGGFNADAATGTVVLPLIMNANSTYWTSISIMNVGMAETTVTCTFTPYGGIDPLPVPTATLAAGTGVAFLQNAPDEFGSTKYIGSATCTTDPAGQIVAVVNELGGSPVNDQLLVYEGFNTTP